MSMIIYVMIHIERAEDIENNRRIGEIARETFVTTLTNQVARTNHTVNMDDVCAALPLRIKIGLHNPVTSDWIRFVRATAKPLNVTTLVRDTLVLENEKRQDTSYSHACKPILFADLDQHRVKTGAPAEGRIAANHLLVHAGDAGGITRREKCSTCRKMQRHVAVYHWTVLE
jgi:hypothetical protein